MKIVFNNNYATVQKSTADEKFKNESALWYGLKKLLISMGHDVIKKNPDKDGQMTSAPYYVRTRKRKGPDSFLLHDDNYAVRDLAKDFNTRGEVHLLYLKNLDAKN